MAAEGVQVKIEGLAELKARLSELAPKLRRRALRNALAAGARIVRDAARSKARVIPQGSNAVAKGYRRPGTVRDAIVVRTSKQAARSGDIGVFVNVRPAKGAKFKTTTHRIAGVLKIKTRRMAKASQRGAKSPTDPFYWRFLEFGTKRQRTFSFLRPAVTRLQEALRRFQAVLGPQLERLNANARDRL